MITIRAPILLFYFCHQSSDGKGLSIRLRIFFGLGLFGKKHRFITALANENDAMMVNIPNHPKAGLRNSVKMAITGAATACPVITSP